MDDNFKILNETNKYVLGHIFEETYLFDKETNERYELGSMYGDPSCGLIDQDNKWCVIGGSTVIIWTTKETTELEVDELYWACRIRQINLNSVQILIDPWADNSSIWELNILDKSHFKICDFKNYKDKAFTEQIEW
ncbi:MAG: hypothetical protein U0264_02145 [Candidatus Kapaibacterium sp.]